MPFEQPFLDTTKTDYGAELEPEDFASDPDTARATINDWVASQTDDKITQLFPAGSIDPSTRLVLANAILFEGSWNHQFDPKRTAAGTFHVAGGADVTAQLMSANIPVGFAPIAGGRLGVLPFEGKDLAFVVALPDDPDGLPALEAQLSGSGLAQALAGVTVDDAEPRAVTLPKFSFHSGFGLVPVMQALGVTDAFDATLADLSRHRRRARSVRAERGARRGDHRRRARRRGGRRDRHRRRRVRRARGPRRRSLVRVRDLRHRHRQHAVPRPLRDPTAAM